MRGLSESDKIAVGLRIKSLRKEKEMTLETWSALFGGKKNTASQWEHGTVPHRDTLKAIADETGKSIDWIIYGTLEEYIIFCINKFSDLDSYSKDEELVSSIANHFSRINYPKIQDVIFKLFEKYPDLMSNVQIANYLKEKNISGVEFVLTQIGEDDISIINLASIYIKYSKILSLNENDDIITLEMKKTGLSYPELIESIIKNILEIQRMTLPYIEQNNKQLDILARKIGLDLIALKDET